MEFNSEELYLIAKCVEKYADEADEYGWVFHTNMPWEEYEQIDIN